MHAQKCEKISAPYMEVKEKTPARVQPARVSGAPYSGLLTPGCLTVCCVHSTQW
jgi:hypothetical protein